MGDAVSGRRGLRAPQQTCFRSLSPLQRWRCPPAQRSPLPVTWPRTQASPLVCSEDGHSLWGPCQPEQTLCAGGHSGFLCCSFTTVWWGSQRRRPVGRGLPADSEGRPGVRLQEELPQGALRTGGRGLQGSKPCGPQTAQPTWWAWARPCEIRTCHHLGCCESDPSTWWVPRVRVAILGAGRHGCPLTTPQHLQGPRAAPHTHPQGFDPRCHNGDFSVHSPCLCPFVSAVVAVFLDLDFEASSY